MRGTKRTVFLLLVLALLAFVRWYQDRMEPPKEITVTPSPYATEQVKVPSMPAVLLGQQEETEKTYQNPEEPVQTTTEETEGSDMRACPQIENLTQLRDYLHEQVKAGNMAPTFRYTGDPEELEPKTIAQILNCFYVLFYDDYQGQKGVYQVEVMDYPGDRIVKAYKTGDVSTLTEEERRALELAEQVVSEAWVTCTSDLELEIAIHDWLVSRVTYDNSGGTEIKDTNDLPRHLTALGALLDGVANCQGYTDGFYTLASVAGFEVGRMSVQTAKEGHMVNTICLDGKWYVVDVTFDDYDYEDATVCSYRLLNAGRDLCQEFWWGPEMEYNAISDYSDGNYYYYAANTDEVHSRTKAFTNLETMADRILDERIGYGCNAFQVMLRGKAVEWTELRDALNEEGTERGISISYTIWTHVAGENTYFIVRFQ